ncbi:MAG TPA: type I DNA topoisomerase [Anaerovoracaceae bacterium]|nr:type I DNA topoisomerase [Anaerovoracaceae bacterium]
MTKTLLVVESPAKAKTLSKYLGPDFIIRASYGHIIDLASGGKHGIGVDIDNNFKPKYVVIPDKKDKLNSIIDAASQVDQIFLASDPDREGEAIAWHLAGALESTGKPIKRVLFHEITKTVVQKAIANPGELDADLYDAQQARRVLDRIVGFLVSPFLMNSIGPNLSAGRVQSVATRIIVDREREIENFKPEEYWNISTALAKPASLKESFVAKYSNKVTNKETAEKVKKDLDTDTYEIIEVIEKEKARNPLPPLETASLSISAGNRYKFPGARTMKAAQSLYEAGLITYMRTDSLRLSPEAITSCRDWLGQNSHAVPAKPNVYAAGAQDAHEAIRPTDVAKLPQNVFVSEDEQKIYRLIWERFVASQMNPALYDTVSLTVKSSSGHLLKANGRILKSKGWLEITGDFESDDDDTEAKLPVLKKGDKVILVPPKVKAEQKFTQPPPRYSENTLVKELKRRGIGRPSTYVAIVSKITDRSYVIKKANMLVATDLGKKVIDSLVKSFHFMEIKYTAEMEEQLDNIAEGKIDYLKMLNAFYTPFSGELKDAYSSNKKDFGFVCDKCNKKMELKHGKFGFFMACTDYPTCKSTFSCEMVDEKPVRKVDDGFAPQPIVSGTKCPKCGAGMVKKDGKFGPFYSCSTYPKCNGSGKVPFGKQCDKCGKELYATVFDGKLKLACMGYPECRNIEEMPKDSKVNWMDPKDLKEPKLNKAVKKVLNSSRAAKS